jgi:hypothetical protein
MVKKQKPKIRKATMRFKVFVFFLLILSLFKIASATDTSFDLKATATQPVTSGIDQNLIQLGIQIEQSTIAPTIYRGSYPNKDTLETYLAPRDFWSQFTPFACGQICSSVSAGDIFWIDFPASRVYGTGDDFNIDYHLTFKFLGNDASGYHIEFLAGGGYIQSTPPETCSGTDFGCYLRNAFHWAFDINTNDFLKFSLLKDELSHKPPFGYVTEIYSSLGLITSDTEHPAFELEQVTPITTTIFTPIRSALVWVFVFFFAFALYKQFKSIQI